MYVAKRYVLVVLILVASMIMGCEKRPDNAEPREDMAADLTATLVAAVRDSDLEEIRLSLERGANVNSTNSEGFGVLHTAALAAGPETVSFLLTSGAKVDATDADGNTPLHWAIRKGRHEVARFLIDRNADVNAKNLQGETPMSLAMRADLKNTAELLVKSGANVTIQVAAYVGDLDKVRAFVESGTDVNQRDFNGSASLHAAALGNNEAVAAFLIAHGADVHVTDGEGCTPLHVAVDRDHTAIAKLLIAKGADAAARRTWGQP